MAWNESKWNSAVVDYKGHDFRFSFTIKNFLDYFCHPGEVLESPQMECDKNCGAKWTLQVYAYGKTQQDKDEIQVLLKLDSEPPDAKIVRETYSVYILGAGGRKINMKDQATRLKKIKNARVSKWENMFSDWPVGSRNSILRSEIERYKNLYLPNGHLTIRCEGKEQLDKPNQQLTIVSIKPWNALREMYQEGICTDVILKTGSSEFHCHKCVLSTVSNYFKAIFERDIKNKNILAATFAYVKAMFQHDTKENIENVVDFSQELDEEELRAMLNYIYLGKLELSNFSSVQNLFRVSSLFEIDELKKECESLLNGQSRNA